jgi:hypothetical protein
MLSFLIWTSYDTEPNEGVNSQIASALVRIAESSRASREIRNLPIAEIAQNGTLACHATRRQTPHHPFG